MFNPIISLASDSGMGNLSAELWDRSFADSWALLGGGGGLIFQILTFALTMIIAWKQQGGGEAKKLAISGTVGAVVIAFAWLMTLLAHYAVITPRTLLVEKQQRLAAKPAVESPPFKFDSIDTEGREEIKTLRSQLNAANQTIQALKSDSDAFVKPIASAQFTVALQLADDSEGNGQNMATFAAVALVQRRTLSLTQERAEPLLVGETSQFDTRSGELRITASCRLNSAAMGKPIRTLVEASLLQIELPRDFGRITGGQVNLLINGSVSLVFKVPENTQCQQVGGTSVWVYVIEDLKEGLSPMLTTQPSSTPDKAASPP